MKKILLSSAVILVTLTGCQSTPEYSCDNDAVKTTALDIVRDSFNTNMANNFSGIKDALALEALVRKRDGQITDYQVNTDYENIEFSLSNVRTTEQDKELGNYQCAATLTGSKEGIDRDVVVDIEYTAEAVDSGENFYVEVVGLTYEKLGRFAFLLLDYY
ncbi:hypothetical protein [Psychrobacter cibarius]|uniref:hypothetical protein n=1 Tax=Psychrobacter cibarius TaxID=282669 RepID=UPI0018DEFB50|nr:hypothetical protein [Psychrobacter cibarius]